MPAKRFRMGHQEASPPPSYICNLSDEAQRVDPEFCALQVADAELPKNEASALLAFGRTLASARCGKCKCRLVPNDAAAKATVEQVLETSPNGYIWCKCCFSHTCVGCGKTVTSNSRFTPTTWCCTEGRLLCIWLWLCGLDAAQATGKENEKTRSEKDLGIKDKIAAMKKKHGGHHAENQKAHHPHFPKPANPKGLGYGGGSSPDMHSTYSHHHPNAPYYDEEADLHHELDWDYHDDIMAIPYQSHSSMGGSPFAPKPSKNRPRAELKLLTRMFPAMTILLPDQDSRGQFGTSPPPVLYDLLAKCGIFEAIATLLRNDSFEDIISKYVLYTTVLDVIGRLALHPTLTLLITGPREVFTPGIYKLSTSITDPKSQSVHPIHDLLKKLNAKAQKLRRTSASVTDVFSDREGQLVLKFCEQIAMVDNSVQEAVEAQRADSMSIDEDSDATLDVAEERAKWHREHCIEAVEDPQFEETVLMSMSRAPEVKQRRRPAPVEQAPTPGRMKRIINEINTLQSALPEGIFVRYGSSRPDLMQVLIIGPRDTPYEQGLFEFDLKLPPEYPHKPPKMHFKTTARGKAHFNPNLYTSGMVCLSLLGTWQGTPWDARTSTLLQIFVSIQAMIFCDEPWYNEPGRESREDVNNSKRYNIEIQALTTEWAITAQLSQRLAKITGKPDPKELKLVEKVSRREHGKKEKEYVPHTTWFEDVFDWHFRTFGMDILQQLRIWEIKADEVAKEIAQRKPKGLGHATMLAQAAVYAQQAKDSLSPHLTTVVHTETFANYKFWHPSGLPPREVGAMYSVENALGVSIKYFVPQKDWNLLSSYQDSPVRDKLMAIATLPQPTSDPNLPKSVNTGLPGPSGMFSETQSWPSGHSPGISAHQQVMATQKANWDTGVEKMDNEVEKQLQEKGAVDTGKVFKDLSNSSAVQEMTHDDSYAAHKEKQKAKAAEAMLSQQWITMSANEQNLPESQSMSAPKTIEQLKAMQEKSQMYEQAAEKLKQTTLPSDTNGQTTSSSKPHLLIEGKLGIANNALNTTGQASPSSMPQPSTKYSINSIWLSTESPGVAALGLKLAALAAHFHSPLVTRSPPDDEPVADTQLPKDLQEKLTTLAYIVKDTPFALIEKAWLPASSPDFQKIIDSYPAKFWENQALQLGPIPPSQPMKQSDAQKAHAAAKSMPPYLFPFGQSSAQTFAALSYAGPPPFSGKTPIDHMNPAGGGGPFGSSTALGQQMMPNPPGGPFAGAMPSMPSMPSMSGALAAAQSKQQTFANLAPSYGTPPSPHSVLLTAKATADIDAVEILDMDQLDELVTEKIKLLETLKAHAPAHERDVIEALQHKLCAETSKKAKEMGQEKVFDFNEILEEIHDEEESEGEHEDEVTWAELHTHRGSCTQLKGLVDEYEGVFKEFLKAVGM